VLLPFSKRIFSSAYAASPRRHDKSQSEDKEIEYRRQETGDRIKPKHTHSVFCILSSVFCLLSPFLPWIANLRDSYDEVKVSQPPAKTESSRVHFGIGQDCRPGAPPVEGWRVLEIGCGDGSNILPMAFDYPEGRFVGLDRALNPVEAGRALASRLQLANIELHAADLLEWEPDGEFDYIIAHGIFSWVPEEIREKILKICRVALKPLGVAFIS